MLLIHGLGSSGADWAFQIPALADRFHVITPDLPGCGASAPLPTGPDIAGFAQALWGLLDELGLDGANIAGFSLGGAVALEMALQRPGCVPRLALINSLASYRIDHWRKWYEARVAAAMIRVLGMPTVARMLATRSFPQDWQRPMRERAIEVIGAVPASAYLSTASSLERWEAMHRLDALRCRTLVLAGEHDFTPLQEKRDLADRLGAQFVVARGSRHGTPFDAIRLTNDCLRSLLTDQPMPDPLRWSSDVEPDHALWERAIGLAAEHAPATRPAR